MAGPKLFTIWSCLASPLSVDSRRPRMPDQFTKSIDVVIILFPRLYHISEVVDEGSDIRYGDHSGADTA
jgi:hypothetical protein